MSTKQHEAFLRARRALLMDHAFFGSAVMYLKPQQDPACELLWVDGKHVGYNAEALEALSVNEAAGVLATKVLSCLFEHPLRRGTRDERLWNDACTYVVNPIVRDGGLPLPEGALDGAQYKGLLAEEVYEQLQQRAQQQQRSSTTPPPPSSGPQSGSGAPGEKSEQNQQLSADSSTATGEKPKQNQGVTDTPAKTGPTSPTSAFPQSGYPASGPAPKTQQQAPAQATAPAASHVTGEVRDMRGEQGGLASPASSGPQSGSGAPGEKSEQNQQLSADSSTATGEKPKQNQGVTDTPAKTGPTSPTSAFPQSGYPASGPAPKTQQQAPAQATAPAASHVTGEVRDMRGEQGGLASPAERTANAQEWQVTMQQALNNAEAEGQLPAGLKRVVEEALQTKTPWADELRQFFTAIARDDLSWMRPNRQYLRQKIVMPSVHSERMGPVVFVVDTSGSIDARALEQFEAEANALIEDVRPEVTYVLYVDAAAYPDKEEGYTVDDLPIKFNARGSGGTDFRAAFNWVEAKGDMQPACLVYLTDLLGTFPAQEPEYPVLWACTNSRKAPFGNTIHIK